MNDYFCLNDVSGSTNGHIIPKTLKWHQLFAYTVLNTNLAHLGSVFIFYNTIVTILK